MASDDAAANGKSDARTRVLFLSMQPAKDLEDLAAFLQTLPDQIKTPAQQTVGYLISLGRPGKDENGDPVSNLTLSIRGNEIFAGNRLIANLGPGS